MSKRRTSRPSRTARRAADRSRHQSRAGQEPQPCDCPACTGPIFDADDAATLVDMILGDTFPVSDPTDAECGMAILLRAGQAAGADPAEWCGMILSCLATANTSKAAGMIAALAALSEGPARRDALAALRRGPALPDWAAPLTEPLSAVRCVRLEDRDGDVWALSAEFSRAEDRHAFVLATEPQCGAVADLAVCEPVDLPHYVRAVKKTAAEQHYRLKEIAIDPAEFRMRAEAGVAERLRHDLFDPADDPREAHAGEPNAPTHVTDPPDQDDADGDGPSFHVLAAVLEARLRMLPTAKVPEPAEDLASQQAGHAGNSADQLTLFPELDHLVHDARPGPENPVNSRAPRPKARGTAPIFRLRVDIKGARPPIWRRLEVPGDMTLARLHGVLQTAFGWSGDHLHVFETGWGSFGDSATRSDARVTLDQVAARAGDKISYTYDFGDDWEHVIIVEQVGPRQPAVAYPRCTGGRRAGPPDDCGGIWGYDWLLAVLADPAHEDHADRLDWLGLEHAGQFDPNAFDPGQVTKTLAARFG